jgi:hypothetical protein
MGIFFYREKNRNRLLQLVTELGPLKKSVKMPIYGRTALMGLGTASRKSWQKKAVGC